MGATEAAAYDAEGDALRISAPIRKWKGMGFLRGFAGIGKEVLPKGRMSLPSAAFHEAASEGLEEVEDEAERKRRAAYIAAVEGKLREVQAEAIAGHFQMAALGRLADAALGLFVIALTVGLLVRMGPFHPITFAFLTLFAVKLVFMHFSVTKMLGEANVAFLAEPSQIDLPWDRVERASQEESA